VTFSIVAFDPSSDPPEWGVAVASKFLSVGAAVPWASAGAGAIATQAFANLAYGPDGLRMLTTGRTATEVVGALTDPDELRDQRQLGVVDASGEAATFTGSQCMDWAGGVTGKHYACQGNILTGPDVVSDMAASFEAAEGELGERLLAALKAGDDAGGDRRGRQGAALYIVREGGGYGGGIDKAVDLRVDDHEHPVNELLRLWDLHRLYFPRPEHLDPIDIDDVIASELRVHLLTLGYEPGEGQGFDERLKDALWSYAGTENLEERWVDGSKIDRRVLEHIRGH
jgi:uncharacterized Ntn-hydrolase superfamily protein